jgi:hypothetical protein
LKRFSLLRSGPQSGATGAATAVTVPAEDEALGTWLPPPA